ncbi:MAG: sigma-70 family RNA polymerase sigma factor [Kiritimatiellae bacterium]|nr:sigma-70 family RNA polymerase sigma factor [Kiritimatiellia bacterium]
MDTTPLITSGLLDRLRAGDQQAWAEFFARYDPLLAAILAWPKWHFPPDTRQDVAQNIRVELTKSIGGLQDETKANAFVKTVCVHRCIDEIRRQRSGIKKDTVPLTVRDRTGAEHEREIAAEGELDPHAAIALRELAAELRALVREAGPTCLEAIRAFYVEGLTYKEIATRLAVTVNTVGSRLSKCLEKLRGLIGKRGDLREYFAEAFRQ